MNQSTFTTIMAVALSLWATGCCNPSPKTQGDKCSLAGDTDGTVGEDPCPGSLVCVPGGAGQAESFCQNPFDQCQPDCLPGWSCRPINVFSDECAFTPGMPGCGFCEYAEDEWLWPGQANPSPETCDEDAAPSSLCWLLHKDNCPDEDNPLPLCVNERVHPLFASNYEHAVAEGKAFADLCECVHSFDGPQAPPPYGQWPDTPEPDVPGYPPPPPVDP